MKRLVINRLNLDLRGVSPATAETVARLLGPAFAHAMQGRQLDLTSVKEIDAGRLSVSAAPEPNMLATKIAHRVAHNTSRD